MRRARLKSNLVPEYPYDVQRIVRIAASNGVDLNEAEAEAAWKIRSEEWSASWLDLDGYSDDRVWEDVLHYALTVEEGEAS